MVAFLLGPSGQHVQLHAEPELYIGQGHVMIRHLNMEVLTVAGDLMNHKLAMEVFVQVSLFKCFTVRIYHSNIYNLMSFGSYLHAR